MWALHNSGVGVASSSGRTPHQRHKSVLYIQTNLQSRVRIVLKPLAVESSCNVIVETASPQRPRITRRSCFLAQERDLPVLGRPMKAGPQRDTENARAIRKSNKLRRPRSTPKVHRQTLGLRPSSFSGCAETRGCCTCKPKSGVDAETSADRAGHSPRPKRKRGSAAPECWRSAVVQRYESSVGDTAGYSRNWDSRAVISSPISIAMFRAKRATDLSAPRVWVPCSDITL